MDKENKDVYYLKGEKYQKKIYEIKKHQEKAFVPKDEEEINKLKDIFQVKKYFEILENVYMEDGWEIGYEYKRARLGSEPIVVAYKSENNLTGEDKDEYNKGNNYERFLKHVKLDKTPDSYFQYIMLKVMASQFALGWHANYNDGEIVCTNSMINNILARTDDLYHFDDDTIKKAKAIEPQPYVEIDKEKAIIRTIIFSKWSGFVELKYHLDKKFPHKIIEIEKENLVEYNCGLVF